MVHFHAASTSKKARTEVSELAFVLHVARGYSKHFVWKSLHQHDGVSQHYWPEHSELGVSGHCDKLWSRCTHSGILNAADENIVIRKHKAWMCS